MRVLSFSLVILILSACPLAAEEKSVTADKPLLFVNTNSAIGWLCATNSGLATFADIAKSHGYKVAHGVHSSLNEDTLGGKAVYLLMSPKFLLLDEDKQGLKTYIRNGGVVMMWYYVPMDWDNLNSFTEEFGFKIKSNHTGVDITATVLSTSPLTGPLPAKKLESIGYIELEITDPSKVVIHARYVNGTPMLVECTSGVGKGKLFVSGDLPFILNNQVGGTIEKADGENFVSNLFTHLTGQYDFSATLIKMKGKSVSSGESKTITIKIKNVGNNTSDKSKALVYLSDDGVLNTGPSSNLSTLKKISIPAIKAGKVEKIKTTVKIPAWVTPGTYYLILEVDPSGKDADSVTDNDVKVSKAFTVN